MSSNSAKVANLKPLGYHIYRIDAGLYRPGMAAFYLMIENGKAAFIDCGTGHSVEQAKQALAECQLSVDDVELVIPTHVHLDHAGGAGKLMATCPNARLVVHPRGARHMIDPSRLIAGSEAVYGKAELARRFGEILPIAEERVHAVADDEVVELNGRPLRLRHTPGHANHHICIWDETSQGWFTGDTFGLSYRELDIDGVPTICATTTPIDFDPEGWQQSLDTMLAAQPQRMFLTHYGCVENVRQLAAELRAAVRRYARIAKEHEQHDDREAALVTALLDDSCSYLAYRGSTLSRAEIEKVLGGDLRLNAQGLSVWLDRQAKKA